jgi:2-isopropylmalate synthase
MLPHVVRETCLEVRKRFDGTLGIRVYDDSGLAVACTIEAVEQGFTLVEGSIGGTESSGRANLCSIIADLDYKLGHTVIGLENLEGLPGVAAYVANAAHPPPNRQAPRDPATLLHSIDPRLYNSLKPVESRAALDRIRLLEYTGCHLASARGTLELLVRETLQPDLRPFEGEHFEVACHSALYSPAMSTATVTLRIGDAVRCESEQGSGPVDALERALRQCLFAVYPLISGLRVIDYHVRTVDPVHGSAPLYGLPWIGINPASVGQRPRFLKT